jgi:hypothetical protein
MRRVARRAGREDAELLELRRGDRLADVQEQRRPTRRHCGRLPADRRSHSHAPMFIVDRD